MFDQLSEFYDWFADRTADNVYQVSRTPLEQVAGWRDDQVTGNLTHASGKFFSVLGVEVTTDHRVTGTWRQPIILQPEVGILGLLVKVVNGTVYCLMQAKMEPGNINLIQLSPTVQATRSNYTRVHGGDAVPYLEYFLAPRQGHTVFDALQSEQGSWFLKKRNRNMIVEVTGELPARKDFCWLSMAQIIELLKVPNLVNMDSRTVLSGIPFLLPAPVPARGPFDGPTLHPFEHVLSWFCEAKSRYHLAQRVIALSEVPRWQRVAGELVQDEGRYFSVMGVDVTATNREVGQWSQPMLEPAGRGVIGFLGRRIDGVFHILMNARTEAGTQDVVEIGPTVACIPANYVGLPAGSRPRYLDVLYQASAADILVDVVHSEEGGRFFHAENRYLVVDVGEEFDLDVPDDYCWMTASQLSRFVRFGNLVNVAARCLLSCLVGLLAEPDDAAEWDRLTPREPLWTV